MIKMIQMMMILMLRMMMVMMMNGTNNIHGHGCVVSAANGVSSQEGVGGDKDTNPLHAIVSSFNGRVI